MGLETEVFTATPHVQAGTLAIDTRSSTVGTFREAQAGLHFRMTTWAFNAVFRYPGARWQPYIGLGPAIFFGHVKGTGQSCNNTCVGRAVNTSSISPGLTAHVGLRYLLTPHVSVFGETKFAYTQAHFDRVRSLSDISVSYQMLFFLVGAGYHF